MPPVLFTLTQVVLLLITSTFTRVQIQSNLGTTSLTLAGLLGFGATTRVDTKDVGVPDGIIQKHHFSLVFSVYFLSVNGDEKVSFWVFAQ